jgi:gliding motility-associated-like protein
VLLLISFKGFTQPVANFSANQTYGCAPMLVQFTSLSTNNPINYLWDFGNGNKSTLQNPSASFVTAGKYTVKLTVSNSLGTNIKTMVDYITVYPLPSVDFQVTSTSGCAPLKIGFTDISSSPLSTISAWSWDFGDGQVSNLKNPFNTFSNGGSYHISLMVTDGNGCKKALIKNNYILVQTKPIVDFTASPFFGCTAPFATQFTSSVSPASVYSYKWDFGNGNQSTAKDPAANYAAHGQFNVSLRVTNAAQCTVNVVKPAFIKVVDVVPNFIISGTPDLCAPGKIALFNTTNFDTFGITYEWYLNGALVSNFKHPVLNNLAAGTYSLELKVKIGNCIVNALKPSFFTVLPSSKSNFDANRLWFCKTPANVNFRDSSINAVSWQWNFGNSTSSSQKNPSANYLQNGTYTVSLITTHANGCKDTLVRPAYIVVKPAMLGTLIQPRSGCFPLAVQFFVNDTNTPPFTQFNWNFGKVGANATSKNANYTYLDTGIYLVTLLATTVEGCSFSKVDTVKVGMPVKLDFSSLKRVYCYSEQPVVFTKNSIPNLPNLKYTWTPIDTSIILSQNENQIVFKDTGTFDVGLVANHHGCLSDTVKQKYIRILGPIARFTTSLAGCSKSFVTFNNLTRGGNKFIWNFGDGWTSSSRNVTHDYDSSGTYLVTLLAIDTLTGCSSVHSLSVNIQTGIKPSFTMSEKVACMPHTLTLTNTTQPASDFVFCEFTVGGNTYTGNKVNALLVNPGKYSVTMNIRDKNGCSYTLLKTDSILVSGGQVKLNASSFFGCAPMLMQVVDSSRTDLPIRKRIWYWGTGDSTVYGHPDSIYSRYIYQLPPAYQNSGFTLKLVVEDSMGCRFSLNRKLFISKPKPLFTFKQEKNCIADTFVFTPIADDLVGLTPMNYTWNIDNHISTARTLKKVYSADTSILVKLIATDAYNCKDSFAQTFHIVTGPPKVDFDANPKKINCPGPPIYFTDYSKAGTTPIKNWYWEFGDGGQSSLQNPTRIYLLPGSYSVKLTLTDSIGCTSFKSIPDMIVIGGPQGNFTLAPNYGCVPLTVDFSATATNVIKFEWDMGDGTIDTNANTKHTYTQAGRYIPNLTLTDSAGCKVGLPPIDSISVFPNPQVDFFASKKKACLGASITLTGDVVHPFPVNYHVWNIDGVLHYSIGPHTYLCNRLGNIPVMFKVIDDQGCVGQKIDSVAVSVFKDTIPPQKPTAYRASVETDEMVSFSFPSNTEVDFDYYLIHYNWNGVSFGQQRPVNNLNDTFQYFNNLSTRFYNYSYEMQAVDVCNNRSEPSRRHTTVELKANGVVNAVQLNWTPYVGWDSVNTYVVYRLNEQLNLFEKIGEVPGSNLAYVDSLVYCHKLTFYKVMASYGGQVSMSDTAAAIPLFLANTPHTRTVRATVENNRQVLVQWQKRNHKFPYKFVIEKRSLDPNRMFKRIVLDQTETAFLDADVDVQNYAYEYLVFIEDACGGLGEPSNMAKSLLLQIDMEKNDKLVADPVLSWNPYKEWASGVELYELFFRNDSLGIDQLIATKMMGDTFAVKHNYLSFNQDDYCYQVVAYQKDSNWVESWSNLACMNTAPRLYAPNAFTCNGDLLNDGFLIQGVFIKSFELRIYNRWGETVYETTDLYAAWDGTFNGAPAPSDVYVFVATGYGRKGKFATLKGNVTLLR